MSAQATALSTPTSAGRRLRRRNLWLVPGLAIALLGSLTDSSLTAIGIMVAFGIAPHLLAAIAGIGQAHPGAQMAPRAIRIFNATHEPIVPAAIVALYLAGLASSLVLVAGTAWMSHVVIGWGIGDQKRSLD